MRRSTIKCSTGCWKHLLEFIRRRPDKRRHVETDADAVQMLRNLLFRCRKLRQRELGFTISRRVDQHENPFAVLLLQGIAAVLRT